MGSCESQVTHSQVNINTNCGKDYGLIRIAVGWTEFILF